MKKLINQFIDIRAYLEKNVDDILDVFLVLPYEPPTALVIYNLSKEVSKVIENTLHNKFPNFPKELLPKVKFKVEPNEQTIQVDIQSFFNEDSKLSFLANTDVGTKNYDLYYKKSYDIYVPYTFYAKYDHSLESVIKGSRTAAEEYITGKNTPLSVAFEIAQEEGVF